MKQLIVRGYKYRLRSLTAAQRSRLSQWVGCRRFVWNWALSQQLDARAAGQKMPTSVQLDKQLPALKAKHPWLADAPSQALQQVLRDLNKAWQAFFRGDSGVPRKKKRFEADSCRLPQGFQLTADGVLRCPKGNTFRVHLSRPPRGTVCELTIGREADGWYATVTTQRWAETAKPVAPDAAAVRAFDWGVANTISGSDGKQQTLPLARIKKLEARGEHYQRMVSRRQKGSNRRRKAVHHLARVQQQIARVRGDWLAKATTRLADDLDVVGLEDLKVKNMTSAPAPKPDEAKSGQFLPNGASSKAGLNRAILRAAPYAMRQQFAYKLAERGKRLAMLPAAYSSQECAACGHRDAANRPDQATFKCVHCGHAEHADINAAQVLHLRLLEAIRFSAAGQSAHARSSSTEEPSLVEGAMPSRPTKRKRLGKGAAAASRAPLRMTASPGNPPPSSLGPAVLNR